MSLAASIRTAPSRFESWLLDGLRSTIAVALVRIIVGIGIFLLVIVSWTNRRYYWGDASGWQDPQRETGAWGFFPFTFFTPDDTDGTLQWKLAVVAVLGVMIAIGLLTRLSVILAFFTVASLGGLGPYAADSGDNLVRLLLFYLVFTAAGSKWSIDALIRRRFKIPYLLPNTIRFPLHNLALIAIGAQTIIIYVIAGLTKMRGETWLDGSALYYALQTVQYVPWPGLNDLLISQVWLVSMVTWGTVVLQLAFPILLLNHYTRVTIVLLMMGMHFGIGVFMGLGVFSLIMFAADLIFIRDNEFKRLRDDWNRLWTRRSSDRVRVKDHSTV